MGWPGVLQFFLLPAYPSSSKQTILVPLPKLATLLRTLISNKPRAPGFPPCSAGLWDASRLALLRQVGRHHARPRPLARFAPRSEPCELGQPHPSSLAVVVGPTYYLPCPWERLSKIHPVSAKLAYKVQNSNLALPPESSFPPEAALMVEGDGRPRVSSWLLALTPRRAGNRRTLTLPLSEKSIN